MQGSENVVHFLRECQSEKATLFKEQHLKLMPSAFADLPKTVQSTFILGGSVKHPSEDKSLGPTLEQDGYNEVLVGQLWDLRKEALDASQNRLWEG